jgi:phosphinothricin acetyltransferase
MQMPDTAFGCRDATWSDLSQAAEIYVGCAQRNEGAFEDAVSAASVERRFRALLAQGMPFRVAVRDDRVIGLVHGSPYQPRPGFAHCLQNVICLAPEERGRGTGAIMLGDFLFAARAARYRQVVAFILAEDDVALCLHETLGFTCIGRHRDACRRGDRLHDVMLMRRDLDRLPGAAVPPARIASRRVLARSAAGRTGNWAHVLEWVGSRAELPMG